MLPYNGTVRLIVCQSPWKIALNTVGLGMTLSTIRLEWVSQGHADWETEGISELIVPENRFFLQLEHSWGHLRFPVVESELQQSLQTPTGWRFDFKILSRSEDLLLMFDELRMGDENRDEKTDYGKMLDRAFGLER